MKKYLLLFILMSASLLMAGDLTLLECYRKAEASHPLQKEMEARGRIEALNRKNLNAKWLPTLDLNAGFTYMSDVAEFNDTFAAAPFPFSGLTLPNMPKDQYKATIDIRQTVFDGGAVRTGKRLEKASLEADLQSTKTELYSIRDQINQAYFGILSIDKSLELAKLLRDEINQKRSSLLSAVENGVVLPSELDNLDAEILKVDQQISELELNRQKARYVLESLVGEELPDGGIELPRVSLPPQPMVARPELQLFQSQKNKLEMSKKAAGSARWPKAFLYASYGYGNPPGSDFFNDTFDAYYVVGAGLTWNIFDWNSTRRTREALSAQQARISARQDDFDRKINLALNSQAKEIEKLEQLIESDQKLIGLRHKITLAAASKLDNGTISATDYLTQLNAEHRARINAELHKIQLVMAKVTYLTISGQIDEQLAKN